MAVDLLPQADAMSALEPGPLVEIGCGALSVSLAPQAGGRIAQIRRGAVDHLVASGRVGNSMIAWGCYPMLPWAGRIRDGRFSFAGRDYLLPTNLGRHAIHGVGFAMPWMVEALDTGSIELSLQLPQDARWPFGGTARQRIVATNDRLRMELSLQAGARAMPAVIGWHPWFRKPQRLEFFPRSMYPRDAEGMATLPVAAPSAGPWDDCFINHQPVAMEIDGARLRLQADCEHWVVYDATAEATCIEPQSGPPDAFNLAPLTLAPGATLQKHFVIEWQDP